MIEIFFVCRGFYAMAWLCPIMSRFCFNCKRYLWIPQKQLLKGQIDPCSNGLKPKCLQTLFLSGWRHLWRRRRGSIDVSKKLDCRSFICTSNFNSGCLLPDTFFDNKIEDIFIWKQVFKLGLWPLSLVFDFWLMIKF